MRAYLAAGLALAGAAIALVHCSGQDGVVIGPPDSGPDVGLDGPVSPCLTGRVSCGADCVDTMTDTLHCGGCTTVCTAKQACVAGACVGCEAVDLDKDGDNSCNDCNDNGSDDQPRRLRGARQRQGRRLQRRHRRGHGVRGLARVRLHRRARLRARHGDVRSVPPGTVVRDARRFARQAGGGRLGPLLAERGEALRGALHRRRRHAHAHGAEGRCR